MSRAWTYGYGNKNVNKLVKKYIRQKAGEAMSLRMWENYPEYITDG